MNMQVKLSAAAVALAMSFSAQADIIDLFSTAQPGGVFPNNYYFDTVVDGADTGTIIVSGVGGSTATGDPTILGGNRDLYVSLLGTSPGSVNNVAGAGVTGGVLSFNNSPGAYSRTQIQWDGGANTDNTINYTGLSGYDLTAGGASNSFLLDVIVSDAGFDFTITLYTDAVNYTKVIIPANAHVTPTSTPISFGAFLLASGFYPNPYSVNPIEVQQFGSGVTLANLGAMVIDIDQFGEALSIDLQIDSLTTIPEPGVLALMGMGLLAAGFAGRRKSKA